jgi:hypothetical protein
MLTKPSKSLRRGLAAILSVNRRPGSKYQGSDPVCPGSVRCHCGAHCLCGHVDREVVVRAWSACIRVSRVLRATHERHQNPPIPKSLRESTFRLVCTVSGGPNPLLHRSYVAGGVAVRARRKYSRPAIAKNTPAPMRHHRIGSITAPSVAISAPRIMKQMPITCELLILSASRNVWLIPIRAAFWT